MRTEVLAASMRAANSLQCKPRRIRCRYALAMHKLLRTPLLGVPSARYLSSKTRIRTVGPMLSGKRGLDLLQDPILNKNTAWSSQERDALGLRGLLPPRELSLNQQCRQIRERLDRCESDLAKYEYLTALRDRCSTLFYRFISENIREMSRIIYTPTVGLACQQFGSIFRRPRGMYFTAADRGHMASMVYNWPNDDVDVIVVTDGGRVLGLGDLGAHGMGISIGKLALYCAGGGIHPGRCLPIVLDVGTDNAALRKDPKYLGLKRPRLDGDEYYEVLDEFMSAIHMRWPNALCQFEDFTSSKAYTVLNKYRNNHLCFNDDIQGTGTVILSGILNCLRAQRLPSSALADQRIVVVGSGSAGLGVTYSIYHGLIHEGLTAEAASSNFWICDADGLVYEGRPHARVPPGAERFARPAVEIEGEKRNIGLLDVIREVKPTILLGLSGVHGVFTEDIVREMAKHVETPIIFPLSNPTSNCEATAEQIYTWTNGRAFFASGSPFEDVHLNGKTHVANQGNNMYIFPGVGLGAVLSGTKVVTDKMFYEACKALSSYVPEEDVERGVVYPPIEQIRDVSLHVAAAVFRECMNNELSRDRNLYRLWREGDLDVEAYISKNMYFASYQPVVYRP